MNKREIKKTLKALKPEMETTTDYEGNEYKSIYIGSYMSLDPCGRYHHIISPNGVTGKCVAFWERLDKAATELGGWIDCGEGDPTDIYFCM